MNYRYVFLLLAVLVVAVAGDDDTPLQVTRNRDGSIDIQGEPELEDDETDLDKDFHGLGSSLRPPSINWKTQNVVPEAVYQGQCNVCGWVSAVQALSTRAAIATDNYQQWSLQNIILCNRGTKACSGTHPNKVGKMIADNMDQLVPESFSPFIRDKCKQYNNCTCLTAQTSSAHSVLLDTQWFFIGPVLSAKTPEEAEEALQSGPLTTCYLRTWKGGPGNHCKRGCAHANSIIGYDKNRWYLQESIGPKFKYPPYKPVPGEAKLRNGTWFVNRNSECAEAVLNKAYYNLVFFDYDKANAYFEKETLMEDQLAFIDKTSQNVEARDFSNIGMAKRRCSLMGSKCKGAVKLSTGSIELIESIGSSDSNTGDVLIERKKQMVIYLRHSSGKYIGITLKKGTPKLALVTDKTAAAPFFMSMSKLISFEYPDFIIGSKGALQKHDVNSVIGAKLWELENANLKNIASGYSLDVLKDGTIQGNVFNKDAPSQRFNLFVSGVWRITSADLNQDLKRKKDGSLAFSKAKLQGYVFLRWQARQILTKNGKPFNSRWKLGGGYFKFEDKDNHVAPTDTLLKMRFEFTNPYLSVDGSKIKLTSDKGANSRWTFEYDDL